jgi:hypothetical protein
MTNWHTGILGPTPRSYDQFDSDGGLMTQEEITQMKEEILKNKTPCLNRLFNILVSLEELMNQSKND